MGDSIYLCTKMKNLTVILLLLISPVSMAEALRQYLPIVYLDEKGLVEAPELLNEKHLDNVVQVLIFYQVKCKRQSDLVLFIDSVIDRETQWNFTSKANDIRWLESHHSKLRATCR